MKAGTIVFKKNWRRYAAGQEVDPVATGIGWGLADVLVQKGFAVYQAESEPGYATMTMQPAQTMLRKRGRPAGSKNRPKAEAL